MNISHTHTHSSRFRLFQALVCRSHSKRGNEAGIKGKEPRGPADTERPQQRRRERKRFDVAGPVGVHPLLLPHSLPPACTTPTPAVLSSQQLSADCLGFLVPIRPIALCLCQTQHLSYHCLDNCLLVQKSLQALRSHDDDMVTLPGGSEPPAEIAYPLSSAALTLRLPPSPSLPIPLPPVCSSFGSRPPIPGACSSVRACVRLSVQTCTVMHDRWEALLPVSLFASVCVTNEGRIEAQQTPGEAVSIVPCHVLHQSFGCM